MASFPFLLAWKRNYLRRKRQQNGSYIYVDKAGFYHYQGHDINHDKAHIFLFPFLSFPWQCAILSIHTVVSGKWRYLWKLACPSAKYLDCSIRKLPGNQVANGFGIIVHHQRHQIHWRRTSFEIETQQQEVRQTSVVHNRGPTCSSVEDNSGTTVERDWYASGGGISDSLVGYWSTKA